MTGRHLLGLPPAFFGTIFNFTSLETSCVNTAKLGGGAWFRALVYKFWGRGHKHSVCNKSPAQVYTTRKCPNRNSGPLTLQPLLSKGRHRFPDGWSHRLVYGEGKDYVVGDDNEAVVWAQRNPKHGISCHPHLHPACHPY